MSRAEDDEIARICGEAAALAVKTRPAPLPPATYRLTGMHRSGLLETLTEAHRVLRGMPEPKDFRARRAYQDIRKRLDAEGRLLEGLKPHYRTPPASTSGSAP